MDEKIQKARKRIRNKMIKEGYTFSISEVNGDYRDFSDEAVTEFRKRMIEWMGKQGMNKNVIFLYSIDEKTRGDILQSIATHYGITIEEALKEVSYKDAENLLDYLTGSVRLATSVLMQKHGLQNL